MTALDALVKEARSEPSIKRRVYLRDRRREPIVDAAGCVVGFATPRHTKLGWRHGPVYVTPARRGEGLLASYYAAHPERDPCVAFVADDNVASRQAHLRAGFSLWRRGRGGQYWIRRTT